jgi:hypothetical protein
MFTVDAAVDAAAAIAVSIGFWMLKDGWSPSNVMSSGNVARQSGNRRLIVSMNHTNTILADPQ